MISAIDPLPTDFTPLTVVIPGSDKPEFLGYRGNARFVGFYWDNDIRGAVWFDGSNPKPGRSQNFTFQRFVRPLGFLHKVNFGTRGGIASHILIWDRETSSAYFAPRESAMQFLQHQEFMSPVEASHALHPPVL